MNTEHANGSLFEMPAGKPPAQKERARNPQFDALGVLDGIIPPAKASKAEAGRIAKALKAIREISPEVTAEEIASAAEAYRNHWPQVDCTSTALAAHWRKFSTIARAERQRAAEMESIRMQMMNAFGDEFVALQRRLQELEDGRESF